MKYTILFFALSFIASAQYAPPRYHERIDLSASNLEALDSLVLYTAERAVVIERIAVIIDSAWTHSDSLKFGISGRGTWGDEFGAISASEYVDGTIVITIDEPTVIYTGERVTLHLPNILATYAGRVQIFVEHSDYL